MARKIEGSMVFVAGDVLAGLDKLRTSQGRIDSMTAYVHWVLKQYVSGGLVPGEVNEVRAIRLRRKGRDEQQETG